MSDETVERADDAEPKPKPLTAEQQAHADFVASAVWWHNLQKRARPEVRRAKSGLSKFP